MLKKFFYSLYYYHYNKVKHNDGHPEIVTLGLISFCQGANLSLIYIIVLTFLEQTFVNSYVIFIILLFTFLINYLFFEKMGFGSKILNNDFPLFTKNIKLISNVYSLLSVVMPMILIFLNNEVL